MNQLPKFYVGQKVVAVKDHSQGAFKKGDKFSITGISKDRCKCSGYLIAIGITRNTPMQHCTACGTRQIKFPTNEWWFKEYLFAPIHEDFKAITFEKIIEKELSSVN